MISEGKQTVIIAYFIDTNISFNQAHMIVVFVCTVIQVEKK